MDEIKKPDFNGLPEIRSLNEAALHNTEKVAEYERQTEEIRREKKFEDYKKCGIGTKFFNESLDTYSPRSDNESYAKNTVVKFCEAPANRILLLHGKNGNGKTHLAAGALRNIGGRYINSSDLCVEFESGADFKAGRNKLEVLSYYSRLSPLLVIDECMVYYRKELEQFVLSRVVCQRYENDLATILITNESKNSFVQFLGKAAYDRMLEACTSIAFDGESYRLLKRTENSGTYVGLRHAQGRMRTNEGGTR